MQKIKNLRKARSDDGRRTNGGFTDGEAVCRSVSRRRRRSSSSSDGIIVRDELDLIDVIGQHRVL